MLEPHAKVKKLRQQTLGFGSFRASSFLDAVSIVGFFAKGFWPDCVINSSSLSKEGLEKLRACDSSANWLMFCDYKLRLWQLLDT